MANELLQKRQALKDDIENERYKSLASILLEGTGTLLQKLSFSKKKVSFWLNAFVFLLLTFLICFLLTLPFDIASLNLSREVMTQIAISGLLGIPLGSLFVIAADLLQKKIMVVVKDVVLDVIELPEDLEQMRVWLDATFSLRSQLLLSIFMPLIVFVPTLYVRNQITGQNLGLSVYLVAVFVGFQAFSSSSVLVSAIELPYQLRYYRVKLFTSNPGSSEVIEKLAGIINNTVLTIAILLAIFTASAFFGNPSIVAINVLIWPWIILITVFGSGHRLISSIVLKAKWRSLNDIQAQIESLQNSAETLDTETLKQINQLLDYYNRIKSTQNSAVDIQAGLNLLQSLLLPLIGLIIANAADVMSFLAILTGR